MEWLKGKPNFYFLYKRNLLESMIEGTCLNIGCGSHMIPNAVNQDEGLPRLDYPDNSFDTVICSDVLEHIGPHKQGLAELMRIARRKVIITVPAYQWLYGKYDELVGHKRRYHANDFSGFKITYLFWFLVPLLWLRKIFNFRHRPLPEPVEKFLLRLSGIHLNFGTTLLAEREKISLELVQKKIAVVLPFPTDEKMTAATLEHVLAGLVKILDRFFRNTRIRCKFLLVGKLPPEFSRGAVRDRLECLDSFSREFLERSGADIFAFLDLSLLTSFRFLMDAAIQMVHFHYPVVIGSRYIPGSKVKRHSLKTLASFLLNCAVRFLLRTGIHDHRPAIKIVTREILLEITAKEKGLSWKYPDFEAAVLAGAVRGAYPVKEIPIWWRQTRSTLRGKMRKIRYVLIFLAHLVFRRKPAGSP